jgi:hypothetical protein
MTKNAPRPESPDALTDAQREAAAALDFALPQARNYSPGELRGLSSEALEGYVYGERRRHDAQGFTWYFDRYAVNNQFRLFIRATAGEGKFTLAEGDMLLDRLASKDGEEALCALMEVLCKRAVEVAKAVRTHQLALRAEADSEPA